MTRTRCAISRRRRRRRSVRHDRRRLGRRARSRARRAVGRRSGDRFLGDRDAARQTADVRPLSRHADDRPAGQPGLDAGLRAAVPETGDRPAQRPADGAEGPVTARLGAAVRQNDRRQDYLRARLDRPPTASRSGPVRCAGQLDDAPARVADCLVIRPPHAPPLPAGSAVPIIPFPGGSCRFDRDTLGYTYQPCVYPRRRAMRVTKWETAWLFGFPPRWSRFLISRRGRHRNPGCRFARIRRLPQARPRGAFDPPPGVSRATAARFQIRPGRGECPVIFSIRTCCCT